MDIEEEIRLFGEELTKASREDDIATVKWARAMKAERVARDNAMSSARVYQSALEKYEDALSRRDAQKHLCGASCHHGVGKGSHGD